MKHHFYISKIFFVTIFILSSNTFKINAQDSLYLVATITGESHEKRITDVKGIGDVNGDGYDDFIVTSYNDDKTATLYLGSHDLNLIPDLIFHYPDNGDLVRDFGISAGIGDVNGDGYDDFLIKGAFNYFEKGKCFLYLGGATIDTIPVAEFSEPWIQDYFGQTMEGINDINKDGYDDFIIGSPYNWTNGIGYVYLFWGGDTISFNKCDTLQGYISGDQFGRSIANIGDINKDDFDDIAVGALFSSSNYSGEVYVYYGGDNINSIADTIFKSNTKGIDFGYIIKNVCDLNGDEVIDFIIVSEPYIYVYTNENEPLIINGHTFGFGGYINIEAGGDINNDGYYDFIIGNTNYRNPDSIMVGGAFIYLGAENIDNIYNIRLEGENKWEEFSRVMTIGDINGDGYYELFILSPGYPDYENSLGKIYIYSYVKIIDVENDKNALPKNFELNQNYPNPFNPSTVLSFVISHWSFVKLRVFDVLGREITTLVNEEKSSGEYEIKFDAIKYNLSSGVYFCELIVKGGDDSLEGIESQRIKMLYIK